MANLRRFTLSRDSQKDDWKLKDDASSRIVRRFATKAKRARRSAGNFATEGRSADR